MKKIIIGIVAAFCSATFTFAQFDETKIVRDVYVSSSIGSDSNAGTIDAPLKTLKAVPKSNARIFLKSGDIFYGTLTNLNNCSVDAYGKGDKPLMSGMKHLKNPNAWEKIGDDIWRLDLGKLENFDGNTDESIAILKHAFNNIGAIYDSKNDALHGHLVKRMSDMKAEWDFFTSEISKREELTPDTFKYIYVKCSSNPSANSDLHFVPYLTGMSGLRSCVIKNIALRGYGRHGITPFMHNKIDNVDIDVIGGGIQVGYKSWVRLGNGVECWIGDGGSSNFNIIQNCTISRTYDCGSTIQGIGDNMKNAEGIKFINNKFYRCRQAFEHFLSPRTKGKDIPTTYVDCEFSGNKCFEMGDNEFSTPERRDVNLLSYEKKNQPIKIHDNTFYGSGIYCGKFWATDIKGNIFYVFKGESALSVCHFDKNMETITANGESDIAAYRKRLNDNDSKIIIVERSDIKLRGELIEKEFSFVKKFRDFKAK